MAIIDGGQSPEMRMERLQQVTDNAGVPAESADAVRRHRSLRLRRLPVRLQPPLPISSNCYNISGTTISIPANPHTGQAGIAGTPLENSSAAGPTLDAWNSL